MKKRVVFVAGVIMTVFCACASQKDQIDSSNSNNSVKVTEMVKFDSDHTEKKTYTFTSSEEVETISNEDLVYIVSNDYAVYDFCEERSYHKVDLFDRVEASTKGSAEVSQECIRPIVANIEELVGFNDLDSTIPSECMTTYANAYIADYLERQNTKEPGEETGSVVKDEEIVFCGETDDYAGYSIRYIESRSRYDNRILVTNDIPRAYHPIFLKNMLWIAGENSRCLLLLGELTQEYVEEQLDIYLLPDVGSMLYREVTEDEECYLYTYYYAYMVYGDFGIDDEVQLYKQVIAIDKKSHEVYYRNEEKIKEVILVGTAQEWPM